MNISGRTSDNGCEGTGFKSHRGLLFSISLYSSNHSLVTMPLEIVALVAMTRFEPIQSASVVSK